MPTEKGLRKRIADAYHCYTLFADAIRRLGDYDYNNARNVEFNGIAWLLMSDPERTGYDDILVPPEPLKIELDRLRVYAKALEPEQKRIGLLNNQQFMEQASSVARLYIRCARLEKAVGWFANEWLKAQS